MPSSDSLTRTLSAGSVSIELQESEPCSVSDPEFTPNDLSSLEMASLAAMNLSEQAAKVVSCISGIIEQAEMVDSRTRRERLQREGNELLSELNRDLEIMSAVEEELLKALREDLSIPPLEERSILSKLRFEEMKFRDAQSINAARVRLREHGNALNKLVEVAKRCSRSFREAAVYVRVALQNHRAAQSNVDDLSHFIQSLNTK